MSDTYKNFADLKNHEHENIDFRILVEDHGSPYAVIAIHGGNIEPVTTEIAKAISNGKISFYSFVGGKSSEEENHKLHITSCNFDEQRCVALVRKSKKTISVHGQFGKEEFVMVGGRDDELIMKICSELKIHGFDTRTVNENIKGGSPQNICNRGSSGKGIQLEISRGLRDKLGKTPAELSRFCKIIRNVLI